MNIFLLSVFLFSLIPTIVQSQSCSYQDPSKPYDSGSGCQPCPAPMPFWDNSTQACVANCPVSASAYDDATKWCYTCPYDRPFWNSTDCIECYGIQDKYDMNTGECVATCPEYAPNWNSTNQPGYCLPCGTEDASLIYWVENATVAQCVSVCEPPRPVPDSHSICQSCNSTDPYWDPNNHQCVAECPPARSSVSIDNVCQSCLASTPKWNSDTKVCEACPAPTPYYDPEIAVCVSRCADSTILLPDHDYNNHCQECVSSLSWDNLNSVCTASCPRQTPQNNTERWCSSCPLESPKWDSSSKTCVPQCPPSISATDSDGWCVACPRDTPLWNPLTTSCEACAASTSHWDPSSGTGSCVASCPSSRPQADSEGWCIPCNSAKPYWDSSNGFCASTCPASAPLTNAENWCQPCPAGNPFWNPASSVCVAHCPPTAPAVDANNWCGCPSATPKWDSISATCVANCPSERPVTSANNWCQACPAGAPFWDPTNSACVASCPPQKPMKDANNWCKACPSATPYWDPVLASCVSICPQNTPSTDSNKNCQPCPAEFPTWNEVTMQCLKKCPLDHPIVDADNWCQKCPSPTPYWDVINSVCVASCPPQTPNVSPGNWCIINEYTGSFLKWNPIISQYVATCPEELPYFNKSSVPPACEKGPAVQNVVDYLEASGVVMPVALGVMQLAMPGLPYVAVAVLLISLFNYVKYLNINFPAKIAKIFQQGSPNVPSLNFGPFFSEAWKTDAYSHPAPYRFAQNDINGLFMANFWRGITTALIMAFGVVLLKIIISRKFTNKKVILVITKAKNFLIWNYVLSFFISNIANLTLYMFIEYQSLYFHDGLGIGSFVLNLIFVMLSLFGLAYMITRIKQFDQLKQAVKNPQRLQIDDSIKVLLEKFNHEHLMQMLFFPILCIRSIVNAIIMSSGNDPITQCSLVIVLNLIMISYIIRYRPHQLIVDNLQIICFEAILLVVNITCLYLGTLSFEEQYASEWASEVIITCNVLIFVLSFMFILTKLIWSLIKAIKEKCFMKRPSKSISQHKAIEITPRLETAPGDMSPEGKNKIRSLSFDGSINMDVGTEGEQSPGVAAKNLNSNNVKKSFHVVRIPEGAEESQYLSRYGNDARV